MSMLEKIIFIADIIEEERNFEGVDEIRKLAFENIDLAIIKSCESTIKYLITKGLLIHPNTIELRNSLLNMGINMKRFLKAIIILILIISIPLVILKLNKPKSTNILLIGVDAGDYEHKEAPKRSDTIMLVHLEPKDKKIYIYSIPRDTRVKFNGEYRKINSIHAIGGINSLKEQIETMLKIKIDHYIKVDYNSFRELVDAIGGIDVIIPFDMNYDARDIKIHFKKGEKVHLDGLKAEQFVRWRKIMMEVDMP
ncbi:LCP family protein [Caloramator sp. mosi_1]|uniref:LCP family glycopolymer transferase n=1 Tax=Caloramator sp. mosi_1 TaxID=3023090 RepID=UPI002362F841|nr:LCP family protein [Caloramator sp. mosi_1]WDC83883.1 LCP family protein [Caloramator sp. mosi_1]